MLASLFTDFLLISVTTSLIILTLKAISPLISKRYAAKWRYWIWLIVTIRLIVPFNFPFDERWIQLQVPETPMIKAVLKNNAAPIPQTDASDASLSTDAMQIGQQVVENTNNQAPSLLLTLTWIWFAGMVCFLLYHFAAYTFFRKRALRWSSPILNKRVAYKINQAISQLGGSPSLVVRTSRNVPNPMLIGIWKPILFLPHDNYTDHELEFILKHELIHYKRHDMIFKLLILGAQAIHWFNPVVWFMVREASRAIEHYCDETIVDNQSLAYRKQYCEAILGVMQNRDTRSIALATNFTGRKNEITQRFTNILNDKKRRNGVHLLGTVALLTVLVGVLAACTYVNGSHDHLQIKQGTIYSRSFNGEQIIVHDAGNSYSLDEDGNLIIAFRHGEVVAETPLTIDTTGSGTHIAKTGLYISEDKTAIVYGDTTEKTSRLRVLISEDEGKSWHDYAVQNAKGYETTFIGFSNKHDGWIVAGNTAGVGNSHHDVYQTSDGGKTWVELGNPNDLYTEQLTGAGFSTNEVGFLGFRYYVDDGPIVYWTKDQGQSWEKLSISLPEKFNDVQKTPLSPVFNENEGMFPILLSKEADVIGTIYLYSKDGGLSWSYDPSYDHLDSRG